MHERRSSGLRKGLQAPPQPLPKSKIRQRPHRINLFGYHQLMALFVFLNNAATFFLSDASTIVVPQSDQNGALLLAAPHAREHAFRVLATQ